MRPECLHCQSAGDAAAQLQAAGWDGPLAQLLCGCTLRVLGIWHPAVLSNTPALVPTVLRTLLPLVQQLQACGPQLLAAAAEAAGCSVETRLQTAFAGLQQVIAPVFGVVLGSNFWDSLPKDAAAEEQKNSLLQHPAVAELLLQDTIACTAQLHQRHAAYTQQGKQQCNQPVKQQHRADLLHIPAFHTDMLQLLPGAQAYLDAAAAAMAAYGELDRSAEDEHLWLTVGSCCMVLTHILRHGFANHGQADVVSAAAVRLVLELQLLAAAEHQRWRQQQKQQQQQQRQQYEALATALASLLLNSGVLLHTLIRAAAQGSGSCLPPEVLQQAGLQLLQALAAPLQQLQLGGGNTLLEHAQQLSLSGWRGHSGEACHALVTAACGPAGQDITGAVLSRQLQQLAAAHPVAYLALVDCLLRSPVLHAEDMLAVPFVLLHAFDAVLHSELAGDTTAAAALASALSSLTKRMVQLTKFAAAVSKAESSQAAAAAAVGKPLAAACFPAAVCFMVGTYMPDVASLVFQASSAAMRAVASRGAGNRSSQASASAALLVVVLARSLVQLADAMEAVGPQLYHECLVRKPQYPLMWAYDRAEQTASKSKMLRPYGGAQHGSAEVQWQFWQFSMLKAVQPLVAGLKELGIAPARAAAASGAAAQPLMGAGEESSMAVSGCSATGQSSSAGSSQAGSSAEAVGSSSQQVKWGYLLQLQQYSPNWAAAAAGCNAKWPSFDGPLDHVATAEVTQLYHDAVGLCRSLADAAPITVVCNNPRCESLAGVSEAAASCKACPGCRCRYCCAVCHKADWKRHKRACKQLAAAGYSCAC